MAYSKQVFNSAKEKLNERRLSALNMVDFRKSQLFTEYPRLSEIEMELSAVGVSTAKAVLGGKNVVAELNFLREKSLALQNERKSILISNGFDESYLEPQFSCDKCKDTGYVETDNKTLTCECFKKLLSSTACEQLNKISPLSLSTFESFNLDFYSTSPDSNGNVPYKRMSKIYDYCLNYAKNFNVKSKGLLMKGETGLGKTHLSLAVANEVINNGYSVVYVSAPDILSKLEAAHFSYDHDSERELMQSLLDCDLLILDDLGTEFTTQFTSTAIYNLFNTRINTGKPVIISTNLSGKELENNYSPRFVSRVMASCDQLDFIGCDIRARL